MMNDWLVVISLSIAMLIGCYLAGCIPLAFTFSEDRLKLLTIFGAGLLVGTALAIIIPEGINTIYAKTGGHFHSHEHPVVGHVQTGAEVVGRRLRALDVEKELPAVAHAPDRTQDEAAVPQPHISDKEPPTKPEPVHQHPDNPHVGQEEHHETEHGGAEHKIVGISLVTGFVFMLIVDQIGGSHSHGGGAGVAPDAEAVQSIPHRNKITATLGLCVHAAADGVALGAATSISQAGLTLIVFIAIMLHKAPAAFGLVSFLLHEGLDRGRIRKHLFLFSAAAPIAAVLTFAILNHQNKETLADYNATGIAMLFSAGTFLYVATVHILPEVASKSSRTISNDGTVIIREHKGFTKVELLSIISGSLLPVGISLGHGHSH